MRTLEELLKDRVLMTKIVWIGFIFSLVLIAIGIVFIARDIFGL